MIYVNDSCGILFLQETWLCEQKLSWLSAIHNDFYARGVSSMTDRDGMRVGRPYGGQGILWRKSLCQSCTVKPLGDPRLLMLEISLDDNRHMTLLNVYLPYDDGSNLEDYQMYLAKVSTYSNCIYSAALGDFNGNTISRKHRFGNQLVQFLKVNH